MKKALGFTLIEVVLAVSILSTLSVLVAISTSRALKSKKKIQAELTDVSSLRDAMKVLRADIHQIYNHFDYEKQLEDDTKKLQTQNNKPFGGQSGTGQPTGTNPSINSVPSTQPQRENKRQDPRTQFFGSENKIAFVTMNQGRLTASELQADFAEVGYELKSCQNLSKPEKSSLCLFRRIQNIIDQDIEKGGTETVILENVKEFNLKYLVEGRQDWLKEWKSIFSENVTSVKPVFPDAIEVNLGIETEFEGKTKNYSLQYIIPLHFPNNIKK